MSKAKSRRREWTSCKIKKVHYDFWTVIQHCISLQKVEPAARIEVYECDFCTGMHVTCGRKIKNMKYIRQGLKDNLKLMSNPDWWIKAPAEVISHRIMLEIELLKKHLGLKPMNYRD